MAHRSGIVAVVGKPNVGKSTFVNEVVGQKVSIVSDKAQTTRRRVLGIATREDWQAAFVDTPGLHEAHNRMGRMLNESARAAMDGMDVVMVMVDVSRMPSKEDRSLSEMLHAAGAFQRGSTVLAMNKMDLLKAEYVERNYETYRELFPAEADMMTSLTRKENVDRLVDLLVERLPEGPRLYPEDDFTDQSMRFLAAEFIREKALQRTRQEVPHALACQVETWEEEGPRLRIGAVLLVEKDGQKAILIGKGGRMLKEIGTEARKEIEEMVGRPIFLELFVKVRDDWRGNLGILKELDYF